MVVWTVANQKGGVGKTTTTVSLAALLANRGARCLLVDLDPHGSMTSYFGLNPDFTTQSVYSLYERDAGQVSVPIASLMHRTDVPRVHLLPASSSLATLDRRFASREGMGLILKRSLGQLAGRFDNVLIDCPPLFGLLMLNALAACESLLIPVQTEFLALKGLERMLHTLGMVRRGGRGQLDYVIVPTLYDQRTRASKDSMSVLRSEYSNELWEGAIPIDTKFRDASRVGMPLPVMAPRARGSQAYGALLEFLLARRSEANPIREAGIGA